MIDKKIVEHIANLSRLELPEEEVTLFTKDLGSILNYVEQLNEVDTNNVEPTCFMVPKHSPLREDEEEESLSKEKTLKNGPCIKKGFFAIPKVIQ